MPVLVLPVLCEDLVLRDEDGRPVLDDAGLPIYDNDSDFARLNYCGTQAQTVTPVLRVPRICGNLAPSLSIVLRDSKGRAVLDSNGQCIYDTESDWSRLNCSLAIPVVVNCQRNPVLTKINRTVAPRLCPSDSATLQFGCSAWTTSDGDLVYLLNQ